MLLRYRVVDIDTEGGPATGRGTALSGAATARRRLITCLGLDADSQIGTGHLMRCLAIADAGLRPRGTLRLCLPTTASHAAKYCCTPTCCWN